MTNQESGSQSSDSAKTAAELSERRSVKGILVRPRRQLKFAMGLVVAGLLSQALLLGVAMMTMNSTFQLYFSANSADSEFGRLASDGITRTFYTLIFGDVVLALFTVLLGIKLSHRIFGPMVPMLRHIENLRKGDYSSRLSLRKDDEFDEIEEALNHLAQDLEKRR